MKMAVRKITAFAAALCIAVSGAAASTQSALPLLGGISTSITASAGGQTLYNKTFEDFVKKNITADMTVTEKLDAICDFLCIIGTTPETADLPIYSIKTGTMGEQRYEPNLYWSMDFFELAWHMAWRSDVDTMFISLNNDDEYALIYSVDGETHARELHVDENGRSCTDRVLTGAELFTYDQYGSVTGYIGLAPEDGVLTLPTVSPTGMTVYNVSLGLDSGNLKENSCIKEVVVPEGITSITYISSDDIEKISIPASVTYVSDNYGVFWTCYNLKEISIAPENECCSFKNNVFYYTSGNQKTAMFAVKGEDIVLDRDTTRIAYFSHYDFDYSEDKPVVPAASRLYIPGKVDALSQYCINSDKISEIVFEEGRLAYLFGNTFDCPKLTDVTIPESITYINNDAFGDANFTVHGVHESEAEWFAERTGRPFVEIEKEEEAPVDPAKTDISGASIAYATEVDYNGSEQTPEVKVVLGGKTLTEGTDYTVSYKNNTDAGTATVIVKGTGDYTGSVKGSFEIKSVKLDAKKIKLAKKAYMKDNGKVVAAKINVYSPVTGERLTEGTDYTIVSQDDDLVNGRSTFTVKGKGNYKGTLGNLQAKARVTVALADVKISGSKFYYNGKKKTPAVTVELNGKTLVNGTDYTVKYGNNKNTGRAAIRITGKGNYSGMTKAYFYIRPQKTTIKSVTSPIAGQVKVAWKRLSASDGYKVVIADNSSFANAKTYYIGSYTKTSRVIKGLTSGKTYYVRTAAFKTIDGRKYFGKNSNVWSVVCR